MQIKDLLKIERSNNFNTKSAIYNLKSAIGLAGSSRPNKKGDP
jgi:hypothetical protein